MGRRRGKDQILRRILEACAGGGATKTQIVYSRGMNFHTVVPYRELITRNRLAVSVEGDVQRYKTTAKGMEALRCLRELEEMMRERNEDEEGIFSSQGCFD